ncbi:sensor histidine kinase [Panacibacter microcysteis]|uniref:sensor histidine kinase n=1 Tax=Panacibacter microcysteis TaxID=2793269 RepID=UPI001E4AA3B1|nr:histidine kinase [Panacibacter microcysteis]
MGQEYNYQHYDLTTGLAGLNVYSVVQDHNGYLWIGTETGLSRFDGRRFRNYTTKDGLPDNEVLKLYVDSKNRVWVLSFTNSICFYENGLLHSPSNDAYLKNLTFSTEPQNIQEDSSGNIIITERKKIHFLKNNGDVKTFIKYENYQVVTIGIGTNNLGNTIIASIFEHRNDSLVLLEVDRFTGNVKYSGISDNSYFTSSLTFILTPKNLAFIHNKNIHYLSGKDFKLKTIKQPPNFVGFTAIDDTSFTLICRDKVLLFNAKRNAVVDTLITGKVINACYKDNENNFWFGTNGFGLFRLSSDAFKNYELKWGKGILPIYSVAKKNNVLYAGANNALLWKINLESNKIDSKQFNSYGEGRVSEILFDREDMIVGINAIFSVNPEGKIVKLNHGTAVAKSMERYGSDLLAATNTSVIIVDLEKKTLKDTVWKSRATCAVKINNDYLVGTIHGLFRVDEKKKITDLGKENFLLSSRISRLFLKDDALWIATYGNGIVLYKNGKILRHITEASGLSSNMCRCLKLQGNYLWVGTDKGLNRINILDTNDRIVTYSAKSGLSCDIINAIDVDDSLIYMGTPYGVTVFDPRRAKETSIAALNIERIVTSEESKTGLFSNITLKPGEKKLYVEYACVSFKSDGDIKYYYQLQGDGDKWNLTRENSLEFASLNPGIYRLRIYAVNAFNKKSNTVEINITVEKFFFQEAWFITLVIIIVGLLVYFMFAKRVAWIRMREQDKLITEQRLNELEQLAFRSQMNPHFIFNCLNSIQQYLFTKDVIEANNFITEFASLIRQTLDISSKKSIQLRDEIKYLSTYLHLEHTRFEHNFDYTINVESIIDTETVELPPLLLQPFIENAIRHGVRNLQNVRGCIEINFHLQNDYLICNVIDNGIGIKAAEKMKHVFRSSHQSKGVSLILERIKNINRKSEKPIRLTVEDNMASSENQGTRVSLMVPVA